MPSSLSISVNTPKNISDLESGQAPFLTPLTKQMRRLSILQKIHDKYFHSSTSTFEEFLQNIVNENLPIEEEEASHPTGRSMIVFGLIQGNSVLAETLLVATNEPYFSNVRLTNRDYQAKGPTDPFKGTNTHFHIPHGT